MASFLKTLIAAAFLASPAAAADVLLCKMRVSQGNQGDMIAKEIFLITQGDQVLVLDDIVNYFNKGEPMVARVKADGSKSVTYSWEVLMVNSAGQRTKMQYRGSLFQNTKEFHVLARPVGYNNSISATGKCAPYNG